MRFGQKAMKGVGLILRSMLHDEVCLYCLSAEEDSSQETYMYDHRGLKVRKDSQEKIELPNKEKEEKSIKREENQSKRLTNGRASEASETLSGVYQFEICDSRESVIPTHMGTAGCLDQCNVRITEHHRKIYYRLIMRGCGQKINQVCVYYY